MVFRCSRLMGRSSYSRRIAPQKHPVRRTCLLLIGLNSHKKHKRHKMKIKRFTALVAAFLLTTFAAVAQQSLEPSAEKLQQHVSYLASDALDGRRTGTAGADDAARYIAGEFERLGLRPATSGPPTRRGSQVMG